MSKESVYDADVFPLMAKIIDVCKANKIAMVATFDLSAEDDPDFFCTTALLDDDFKPHERLLEVWSIVKPQPGKPIAILTTRDKDGDIVNMTAIME